MNESKYITVKDYAEKYNVSVKTVYNWIEKGMIPKNRIKTVLNVTLIRV